LSGIYQQGFFILSSLLAIHEILGRLQASAQHGIQENINLVSGLCWRFPFVDVTFPNAPASLMPASNKYSS
jgi:hypothetical protein